VVVVRPNQRKSYEDIAERILKDMLPNAKFELDYHKETLMKRLNIPEEVFLLNFPQSFD